MLAAVGAVYVILAVMLWLWMSDRPLLAHRLSGDRSGRQKRRHPDSRQSAAMVRREAGRTWRIRWRSTR